MTITDDRSTTPTPAAAPPSYVRRHPILAAFGVLSGLSLFSALWPRERDRDRRRRRGSRDRPRSRGRAPRGTPRRAHQLRPCTTTASEPEPTHRRRRHRTPPPAPAPRQLPPRQPHAVEAAQPALRPRRRDLAASLTPTRPAAHRPTRTRHPQDRRAPRRLEDRRPRALSRPSAGQPSRARASRSRCSDRLLAEKHHRFDHRQPGGRAEDGDVEDAKGIPRLHAGSRRPRRESARASRRGSRDRRRSTASMQASIIATAVAWSTFFGGNSTSDRASTSPSSGAQRRVASARVTIRSRSIGISDAARLLARAGQVDIRAPRRARRWSCAGCGCR